MISMKHLKVCGAILIFDNKVLAAKRGEGKYEYVSFKYEFPGGKIEEGETPEEALHRELIEEMKLDIDIDSMKFFYTVNHIYPDFEITMHTFICPMKSPEVTLTEHVNVCWNRIEDLEKLDWAPADRPVVRELMSKGIV